MKASSFVFFGGKKYVYKNMGHVVSGKQLGESDDTVPLETTPTQQVADAQHTLKQVMVFQHRIYV